ncbi:MAG: DUF389 domain-containing protein [Acidimicrobiales bacterium]|nr:DUF389 domain-containing protein [Acidimicrobiales bacterium]
MLHLRLVVPADRTDAVVDLLTSDPAVAVVTRVPGAAVEPPGDLVTADVVREGADRVIAALRSCGLHHDGSINVETTEMALSDAAMRAEEASPGLGTDALVWEEVEARARDESAPAPSYFLLMALAAIIAACGIIVDSPVLIVGAMVIGPDFGPVAAICVALVKFRRARLVRAALTLVLGLTTGVVASLLLTLVLRAAGLVEDDFVLADRGLTAFISRPDLISVVVALAAGVAGMLTVTEDRAGALVGVLVSVTTIPAAANVGVAMALGDRSEVWGSSLQLLVNVSCLVLAGTVTLAVQRRIWQAVETGPTHPGELRPRRR